MKDDKEHIDKLFESLNDRQFDIPEAFLEDLNKRLDHEPKRRRFFFLWFLASFIFIGATGLCYFLFSDNSAGNTPVNQENKGIKKNEYKASINLRLSKQDQNDRHPVDAIPVRTQMDKNEFEILNKINKQIHTSKQAQSGKVNQLSKRLKTSNKNSSVETDENKQVPGKKPEKDLTPQKSPNIEIAQSNVESKLLLNTSKEPKDSIAKKETDSTITQNTIDTIQQVDSIQVEKNAITLEAPDNHWKKEIQIFAGLGGNSIHDSSKNPEYLEKVNQNQSSILIPSFGVNANLSYKKFTFGLGVKYEQNGERFKVDIKSTELKDSTYSEFIQDTIWVQDSIGNWFPIPHDTTIYHTVQYTDSVWVSRSFHNRYSWISIPLHFGYRFELGDYELIPRLGAVFNVGITQRMGGYPNTSFNNSNRYKPVKFNISYLVQLEARKNFEKCFVFVNPYFQSMINPAVSGDAIRRRYSSWGIHFGIGLKL